MEAAHDMTNVGTNHQWNRPTKKEIGGITAVAFVISGLASVVLWALSTIIVLENLWHNCVDHGPFHKGEHGCEADTCTGMYYIPPECQDKALQYCLYIPLSISIVFVATVTLSALAVACSIRNYCGEALQRQWSRIQTTEETPL